MSVYQPTFDVKDTSFTVQTLSAFGNTDPLCGTFGFINKTVLTLMGYTKYVCPFGVLIVGKSDYKSESMQLAANYVANILDPKATGTVGKDDTIYHELREKVEQEKGLFLAGSTKETDAAACEAIESVSKFLRGKSSSSIPSTDLAAQLLKVGISSVIPGMGLFPLFGCVPLPTDEVLKRKNSEQSTYQVRRSVFLYFAKYGWSAEFPEQFSVKDYTTSTLGKTVAKLQCKDGGWFHPYTEKEVKDKDGKTVKEYGCTSKLAQAAPSPRTKGKCTEASCDIPEFFYQVVWNRLKFDSPPIMEYSTYMESQSSKLKEALGTELNQLLDNEAKYGIPQAALSGKYTAKAEAKDLIVRWGSIAIPSVAAYYMM